MSQFLLTTYFQTNMLKGQVMIFAGQENPYIIIRSNEPYILKEITKPP